MHRYEFSVGPYTCIPFGHAQNSGLFTGAVRASRRIGEKVETETIHYPDRTFRAESDARAYARQRFKTATEQVLPSNAEPGSKRE
jgi:hypothetical protein